MSLAIPKQIFQIWGGSPAPDIANASEAALRHLNPDFGYTLLSGAELDALVDQFSAEFGPVLSHFTNEIQKYDLLRYMVIYRFGGFYFDIDFLCTRGLAELCRHQAVFSFERLTWVPRFFRPYGVDWEVANYAFGAEPGHPVLRRMIDNCIRAQHDAAWRALPLAELPGFMRDRLMVIYTTGPGLVTRTLADWRAEGRPLELAHVLFPEDVGDRERGWNRFGTYGLHLGFGSWRRRESSLRRRVVNLLEGRWEQKVIRNAKARGRERIW